jgi:DNA-binding response OmpR family regulator
MTNARRKLIFIADESDFVKRKLTDTLVACGHRTRTADTTIDLVATIKDSAGVADLLALDLNLPPKGALWMLKWLDKNDYRGKFPVIILGSVDDIEEHGKELVSNGATLLLNRNFSIEQIISQVNTLLYKKNWVRLSPRVPISIPVEYSSATESGRSHMLNLSESGLFLYCMSEFSLGERLELVFRIPGSDDDVNVKGEVVRESKLRGTETLFQGYGVAFTFVSDRDKETLNAFVKSLKEKFNITE